MPLFKTRTTTEKFGGQTVTSKWTVDAKLDFAIEEGARVSAGVLDTMSKSYARRAPKETGKLAEGYVERDSRRIRNVVNRESLYSNVPYAGFVEYGAPRGAKLGLMPSLIRSARTKLRKDFKSRVLDKISDR